MNLNLQPCLKSTWLSIRPLKSSDLDDLYKVANDPLIWEQHVAHDRWKKSEFEKFFDEAMKSQGALLVESRGKTIGSSRFVQVDDNAVEIGWTFLARKYWGGKYNGHLKEIMINYLFEYVDNIVFHVAKENIRSQKAVEKLGAKKISRIGHQHLMKDPDSLFTYLLTREHEVFRNDQV